MTTIVRGGFYTDLPKTGEVINVSAWCGNVRPFRAYAFRDGKLIGRSGFCISEGRAIEAAENILRRK